MPQARPLQPIVPCKPGSRVSLSQRSSHSPVAAAVLLCLMAGAVAYGQSPPASDRPWPIPAAPALGAGAPDAETAIDRHKRYELPDLIDLAQRSNPETREAWDEARQA